MICILFNQILYLRSITSDELILHEIVVAPNTRRKFDNFFNKKVYLNRHDPNQATTICILFDIFILVAPLFFLHLSSIWMRLCFIIIAFSGHFIDVWCLVYSPKWQQNIVAWSKSVTNRLLSLMEKIILFYLFWWWNGMPE